MDGPAVPLPPPDEDESGLGSDMPVIVAHPKLRGLSELLSQAGRGEGARITLGELLDNLSELGLAPLVLAMGLINIVTIIPGSSTVLGLPLVFLGFSLMAGARRLWLPQRLRRRSFDRAALDRGIRKALPYVRRLERLAHPRYWPGANGLIDRVYGGIVLVLGLLVALPIPFGNTMPAIAVVLLSLGVTARDGFWAAAGLVVAGLAGGVVLGVASLATLAGIQVLS